MAKLDDLIQQKQQRDEDWKSRKAAEREELALFTAWLQTQAQQTRWAQESKQNP